MDDADKHIILFDGVCNLCNGIVRFIIKRDGAGRFKFASLQSESGQAWLRRFNLPKNDFESFVYVEGDKYHVKSAAVLKMLRRLGGIWPVFYVFILIPRPIRDFFYDLIAKSRYKLFGRQDSCMLPTPELMDRFL